MSPGQVFILTAENRNIDDHLWVVISDPVKNDEKVVIVSITTFKSTKDQSCIIDKNELALLTRTSCVAYKYAKTISVSQFVNLLKKGKLEMRDSVSPGLLQRIRRSAANSSDVSLEIAEILADQGIIDC